MKKVGLIVIIGVLLISITSCKHQYEITENAVLIEYGKANAYSFIYDGEYYYLPNNKVVVGLEDKTSKGKFSVCIAYYDRNGNVTNVVPKKTYILKKDNTASLALANGEKEGFDNGEYYRYIEWKEVLMLYEGYNIYVDSSYFE